MSFSDETLVAFADGELDDITRHEVELAMRLDPQLAARVRRHQALRAHAAQGFTGFAPTADEALPQRQAGTRSGKVVHLSSVRAARNAPQPVPPPPQFKPKKRAPDWRRWGMLGGSLALGLVAGALAMQSWQANAALVAVDSDGGTLLARGHLATTLTTQLSSTVVAQAPVRIGISFVSKDGVYCRSFTLPNTGGLACREGTAWRIAMMAATEAGGGEYREAGSVMPGAVLGAIEARITGRALDVNAERAARQQGWKR